MRCRGERVGVWAAKPADFREASDRLNLSFTDSGRESIPLRATETQDRDPGFAVVAGELREGLLFVFEAVADARVSVGVFPVTWVVGSASSRSVVLSLDGDGAESLILSVSAAMCWLFVFGMT